MCQRLVIEGRQENAPSGRGTCGDRFLNQIGLLRRATSEPTEVNCLGLISFHKPCTRSGMLSSRSQNSYSGQLLLRQQQQQQGKAAAVLGSPLLPGPAGGPTATPDKLMTDRSSYITYLESQLERVSAACLSVASYDERLEAVTSAVRLLEERTLNVARLVSCTQQYTEQQEQAQREGLQGLARRLAALEDRLGELAAPQRALEDKIEGVGRALEAKLKVMPAKCSLAVTNA